MSRRPPERVHVAASVLAADFGSLSEELASVACADALHIDVMDGDFVPPITFGTNMVELCRKKSPLFRDVHLMIQNPVRHFERFIQAGAQGITFHIEASKDPFGDLQNLHASEIQAGISLRPETPVESLLPFLPSCSLVLVMTVSPGYGGQAFLPDMIKKISQLAAWKREKNYSYAIQVDGGINEKTAKDCAQAGASHFVAGTYIFQKEDRSAAIETLRSIPVGS